MNETCEYKHSSVGRIPKGWDIVAVGSLGLVVTGNTPRTNETDNYGGSIPFVSPADLGKTVLVHITKSTLTSKGLNQTRQIPSGAVLVVCIGSTIGKAGMASIVCATNQQINSIICKENNPSFVYYLMKLNSEKIRSMAGTQAVPIINKTEFSSILVQRPPFAEQQKIASILTSADEVIEKTQSQINKLKNLKKAMMQELLTKGIGHTEFKDSPVGRIPKEWDILYICDSSVDVLDGDRGNEYPKEKDFMSSGYCLFLSAKNVTKNGFKFDECSFISEEKDGKLRKGRLVKGDIVITTRGTVGNMAYYDESIPYEAMRINSGMAVFRNDDDLISTKFLYQLLKAPVINQQIDLLTFGSAQPQLTIGVINSLCMPVPPLTEQHKVTDILSSIDTRINEKQRKLNHTKSLKKALMQDLLTGRVRVKV